MSLPAGNLPPPPSSLMPWQQQWIPAFLEFVKRVQIPSKELVEPGPISLYEAQFRFLRELDAGLTAGEVFFFCLKARQLGMSTIMLILDVFWLYMHPGLQGALVADTDENRLQFRQTLEQVLENLPPGFRIKVKRHNRASLVLENGSRLQYLVAGKGKNPDLGRSRGLNFLHATEISSWGDPNGIHSLIDTLATENPNRLYIVESTAKGYNAFYSLYQQAKLDPGRRALFIGWWAKELYRLKAGTAEYDYWWGRNPVLDEQEAAMEALILADYGWQMTTEQWAWWRKMADARPEQNLLQEYPWHEKVAFQVTGSPFFNIKRLNNDINFVSTANVSFDGFRYHLDENDFLTMRCEQVKNAAEAELKIWERPVRNARYVMGVDVAYGRSAVNDRHVIEVFRCYADKLVQVAEWATSMPDSRCVAWVLAHLAGSYRDCMINLEVSGPGLAVMNEVKFMRQQISTAHLRNLEPTFQAKDALDQARWFLYHRPDTPGQGYMLNWKALALDTPLPTPTGWTTMGAVQPGEELLGRDGRPTKVLGKSPIRTGGKTYRVIFGDGTSIVADAGHLWQVYRPHWAQHPKAKAAGIEKIRTTAQLMPGKHLIKRAASLQLPEADLPIDPYVLGVWLGDGQAAQGLFYASAEDMPEMSRLLEEAGETLGPVAQDRTVQRRAIRGLTSRLKDLGVLRNKHIPGIYLRASEAQRLALLQGLMDTDGDCSKGQGQCGFTSSNPVLAVGVLELIRSLGFAVNYTERQRSDTSETAYQFWFTAYANRPAFRLSRKKARLREGPRQPRHHQIVSVEEVPSAPVQCLMVDNDEHLFLAGKGMIPTHNTNADNKQEMLNGFRDGYNTEQVVIRSIALLEEMVTLVQNGVSIAGSAGKKDDRPFAAGLAHHAWTQWVRLPMLQDNRTYEREMAKQRELSANGGQVVMGIIPQFFARKEAERKEAEFQRFLNS